MKKQINLLKGITVALVCAILVNLPVVRATTAPVNTGKIDKELLEIINSAKSNDTIPVAIWFNEIDAEKIESEVKTAININRESISDSFSTSSDKKATIERYTNADVDKYIETERELYSKAQTESHNAFIKKHDWLQTNKRGTNEEKIKFVSKYAPMMIAELTVNEILKLTKDSVVQSVYYSPDKTFQDLSTFSNSVTEADFVRDTIGYTGKGVKIGMIESAIPDLNSYYLCEKGTVYDPSITILSSDHATLVASIMIGNSIRMEGPEGEELSFEGVAPDAKLYVTRLDDTKNNKNFYSGIEWLLFKGVNVINMSAGFDRRFAGYTLVEMWIDHIASIHSVHFVIASGNISDKDGDSNPIVYEPALAYNVITVGNVNVNGTLDQNDDVLHASSCYIEHNGNNKPDLVAPGTNIRYGAITSIEVETSPGILEEFSCTGSSFAAPQVAGIVAQLCERQPFLKTNPAAMKAILTSSINHSKISYTTSEEDEYEYDKYGAGMVNARESLITINNLRYAASSFAGNTYPGTTHTYTFNAATSDTIRVSLSWLTYSSPGDIHEAGDVNDTGELADLCFKIYNSNGNQVAYACSSYPSNMEIFELIPTEGETYTIEIIICNITNRSTYYGIAWALIDDGL